MGTHELWMGGVSDTECLQSSGILEQQQQFAEGAEPFVNVLDKGYCVTEQQSQSEDNNWYYSQHLQPVIESSTRKR